MDTVGQNTLCMVNLSAIGRLPTGKGKQGATRRVEVEVGLQTHTTA